MSEPITLTEEEAESHWSFVSRLQDLHLLDSGTAGDIKEYIDTHTKKEIAMSEWIATREFSYQQEEQLKKIVADKIDDLSGSINSIEYHVQDMKKMFEEYEKALFLISRLPEKYPDQPEYAAEQAAYLAQKAIDERFDANG